MSPYCSEHDEGLIMKLCMYWYGRLVGHQPLVVVVVVVCVCVSPYCSAHYELIMKLCMYVGYHDANNVSNFGGDPVTQLNLKKNFL